MPLSKEHILTLLNTPKIGQASAKSINGFTKFNVTSINDLYDAIVDAKKDNSRISLPDKSSLLEANVKAHRILDACYNKGVKAISINDDQYPKKLMRLDDYPIMVYVKGDVSAINSPYSAGVIGTREPSFYGVKAGRRISNILARHGFSIISGLALGCDTVGHLGALDANAPTVAVLASGVDIIYPRENQDLADQIVEQGGALLSEYEVGFRPQKSSFVERDRLQSGLSDGLVVIETDIQGGTMHAVKTAIKLNIPLGCISGHPEALQDYSKTRGTKLLIEQGAASLGNIDQIFSFIQRLNPNINEFIPEDKSRATSKLSENKSAILTTDISLINHPPIPANSIQENESINATDFAVPDTLTRMVEKMEQLNATLAKIREEQQFILKRLSELSTEKTEKLTKKKRPKPEQNHPKLL